MARVAPMPVVHHGQPSSRFDPRLWDSTHVFIRVDAVKRPLVPPYEGPYQVLERSPKTFIVLKKEKPLTVTVDRLKPAVFLPEAVPPVSAPSSASSSRDRVVGPRPRASAPPPVSAPGSRTASGRLSRPPPRFQAA